MMTRLNAFTIHITISAIIAIGVAALMLLFWYPSSLFAASGGERLLVLLLGVDVVLGPLITLVIFNAKKSRKALFFDFSIIGTLQFAALFYGMSVMFESRPVFVAFTGGEFAIATADQMSDADLAKSSNPNFKSLPLTGPVYVYAEMPTDAKEKSEVEFLTGFGKGLQCFPQYYKPYAEHMLKAAQAAKPLAALRKLNEERSDEINKVIKNSGREEADLGFLPLRGTGMNMVVLIGKKDGKVLEILQMNPF